MTTIQDDGAISHKDLRDLTTKYANVSEVMLKSIINIGRRFATDRKYRYKTNGSARRCNCCLFIPRECYSFIHLSAFFRISTRLSFGVFTNGE